MLFKSKPSEIDEVTLLGMDHIPFEGYKYIMWCGRIIYRNDAYEKRRKEWITKQYKIDKNHETIHLMQAKMCGSWVKYYLKYLREWLRGGPVMAPASAAYYTIPFEMEAYANEENFDYPTEMVANPDNYSGGMHKKYVIKSGRKKLYKEKGGTLSKWKEYIKTL